LQVVGYQKGLLAFRDEVFGEFCGRSRFAAALQARQHDHRWPGRDKVNPRIDRPHDYRRPGRDEVNPRIDRPHQLGQLVVDDLDHYLARMEAFYDLGAECRLRNVLAELLDDVVVNVSFQQGLAHLSHGFRDVRLFASVIRPRPESDLKTELNFSVNDSNITRFLILDARSSSSIE